MPLQSHLSFRNKGRSDIPLGLTNGYSLSKGGSFRQHESEDYNEHGRAGSEPEKRAPSMGRSVDETTGENRGQEIAKCIALLQHAGNNPSGGRRAVLERSGGRVAVESTHGNTEERAAREKLGIGLGEAGALQASVSQMSYNNGRRAKHTNSSTINKMLLATKGHLRPYRSAAKPKIIDPTDLNINTSVIPQVISVIETLNWAARSAVVKLTVKKSKASQVYPGVSATVSAAIQEHTQAMNPMKKNAHWRLLSKRISLNGLGALFICGFRVEKRVAKYLPALICSCWRTGLSTGALSTVLSLAMWSAILPAGQSQRCTGGWHRGWNGTGRTQR